MSQLLEQRYLRVPGLAWVAASCLLLAALGQLGARGRYRISLQLSLMLVFLVLLWAGAALLFAAAGTMVEIMAPTLALLLSSLFAMLRQWRQEGDNRRFIQAAFAKYLAPEYVNRLIANPDWLEVGGERREMTFLFTDLAGFTPLTESLEADTLVALVNEYLDGTCEIVTRHGGMVANIVGDALYVIFNAPLPQPDHAGKAVEAALELDRFCLAFQQRKQAAGIPLDVTRIGVNTGDGVIGNYGGSRRLEYTAMGDGINVAARLESVNKHLGTRVCISESTVAQCPDFDFRPVGKLVLKGKSTGVQTYTPVIDEAGKLVAEYAAAYRQMATSAPVAPAEFRRLREYYPDDALVEFHCRRLDAGQTSDLIVMEEK